MIYVDMDDVLCDFSGSYRKALEDNPAIGHPQSQYGFFAKLDPLHGAIEVFTELLNSNLYDAYVLTAPSTRNPLSYTEKRVWIEEKFGYSAVHKLILCPNKSLLKGEFLIDDNHQGKGQEGFEGELLHFGSDRFPNWKSIRNYLFVD